MRYQGRIVRWNEERGFGFIVPEQEGTQKGAELFVHITALQTDGLSPMAGERVSYLMGSGKDGKPRAEQVFFPDRPLSLAASHRSSRSESASNQGRSHTPASTYRRPRLPFLPVVVRAVWDCFPAQTHRCQPEVISAMVANIAPR